MKFNVKTLLATLTAVIMLVSAVGCAPNSSSSEPDSSAPTIITTPSPEASSSPTTAPSSESTTSTPSTGDTDKTVQEKIAEGKANNADTVGWLEIAGTTIDDVVLQADDNDYYLRLNEDKKYDVFGAYFVDYESVVTSRDELSKNTIIYGHSDLRDDKDGVCFSQLFRYTDVDFLNENPNITFSLDGEDMVWEIFSVFFTHISLNYIDAEPTTEEFNTLMQEVTERNEFVFESVPVDGDHILTLSTCSAFYNPAYPDDYRLVIMAKLLPEGATPKTTNNATVNPEPKQS